MAPRNFYLVLIALLFIGVMALGLRSYNISLISARQFSIMGFREETDTCGKWNNEFPCVNASFNRVTFPICTYSTKEDNVVSNAFLTGRYWEDAHVMIVNRQLAKYNDSIFIDIGANIGAFTLGVAHSMKRQVICVEPNRATMIRLRRSICLGKLGDRVTLLHGAVSDSTDKEVRLAQNSGNRGVSLILEGTACNLTRGNVDCMNQTIKTFTLDDLMKVTDAKTAIMKVDAEGSELKIFNEATASKFFEKINVPLIFMEFVYFNMFHKGNIVKEQKVTEMVDFFYNRNYIASAPALRYPLSRDWRTWPTDIVFAKKNN